MPFPTALLRRLLGRARRAPAAHAPVERPADPRLGKLGEVVAARHLEDAGLRVLARNVRTGPGEIDIVAMEGEGPLACVVFVEVKTRRRGGRAGAPEEAVDGAKTARLARAAAAFLQRQRHLSTRRCRFDVVAVDAPARAPIEQLYQEPARLKVRWVRAAFEADPA